MKDTAKMVIEIIATQLEKEPSAIELRASFTEDLKMDSLTVAELVLALEEAFDVQISDEEQDEMRVVEDAVRFIEKRAKR